MTPIVSTIFAAGEKASLAQTCANFFNEHESGADNHADAIRAASRISIFVPRSITVVIDHHGEISHVLQSIPIEPIRRSVMLDAEVSR